MEKINNLQISIEKAKQEIVPYSIIDNLETVVENVRKSEKQKKRKFEEILDAVEAEKIELCSQNVLEKISQERINELRNLCSNCVSYESLRGKVCEKCEREIKKKYRDAIIAGTLGNDSILKSVIRVEKDEIQKKNESRNKVSIFSNKTNGVSELGNDRDKCACVVL